jgi:hypothetical protein
MKKNNSLKLFNKIAKRAYKVSKKRKLGWKWSDAQKWTSSNLFQKYKGTKNLSKVKVTEVDIQVRGILDGTITPFGKKTIVPTPPKPREICFNPFSISSDLLDSFEWFDIVDKVSILNNDVKVDLDLEFNGSVFAKTGITKKELLPNLLKIREDMRKVNAKSGYFPIISFYIVLIEGEVDDSTIACNYYLLITFDNSLAYYTASAKGLIRNSLTTKDQMPQSERERIELFNKQKDEERRLLTKKKAKDFKLPSKLEPKATAKGETKAEPIIKDSKANRTAEYNKAVEKLESFLERGLISKKLFAERFKQLGKNLKDGGEV